MKFLSRLFAFIFCLTIAISVHATTELYQIDPTHSYVLWHISHFGYSHPSGKWMSEGTINADENKPQNSTVNVTIPIANIITGIPKLDEHLQSADFFDVKKYPIATFVSNKINVTGKDSATIQGTLTLHGVSKPVILNVKLNKIGISPITNKKTAGFTATANLKRSDFGIKTYLPGLGDEVKLDIEVEAFKNTADKANAT